ncbi:hypothetical protein PSTT_09339 [Puccinia striiformis]|uniref:Uncharacterized protein n=1 Tax=Puccinia striiformis TaxID=27350 RepID=A0A2S4V8W9_9BASI|nr:hypothetical protein PSTT_09339 [Puccinia striiformis]
MFYDDWESLETEVQFISTSVLIRDFSQNLQSDNSRQPPQETKTVLERCWRTMYPKNDYVEVVLAGQPDLYGALTSYLHLQSYDYDFSKLSLAVGLVYVYVH